MSSDAQLVRNAQNPNLYGRFVDVGRAFTQGYNQATASMSDGGDPVRAVKNNYEKQLRSYLNKLPEDVDLGAIPSKYRNNISEFLMKQKTAYVNAANTVDEYEVGSKSYMNRIAKMNTIRQSFETLDAQMKAYGENKKEMIEMIENQSISLFGENQANVNLLRGVYNEEYDLGIDEYGNVSFMGDDGAVQLNDLPGYEPKDYTIAKSMTDMAVQAYKNGVVLKPGNIMYNQYNNQLKMALDQGGVPRIMSVIHDGLVGDMPMIQIPDIQAAVQNFKAGQLSLEGLRDIVVSNYMDVLVEQSKTGYKVKQRKPKSGSSSSSDLKYNAPEFLRYDPKTGKKVYVRTIRGTNQQEIYYIDDNYNTVILGGENTPGSDTTGTSEEEIQESVEMDAASDPDREQRIQALMEKYPSYSREAVEKMDATIQSRLN